jgi:hypothetical protein
VNVPLELEGTIHGGMWSNIKRLMLVNKVLILRPDFFEILIILFSSIIVLLALV